ncbi:MAG: serine hydrolase, partial [Bacteroidota bacterium]
MEKSTKLQVLLNERSQEALTNQNLVGMSIGLIKDKQSFTTHVGYKNLKTKEVADENTLYELGSIGKLFTA